MYLKDKVAIVTGSTKGIGKEIALEFARRGAKVVISGRNEERANQVCEEIKRSGGTAIPVVGDVANFEAARQLIDKTIEQFGQIDILVNNAGITRDNLLMRMKEAEWDEVITVNLKGAFNCIKPSTALNVLPAR